MYKKLFKTIVGLVGLTGIGVIDGFLAGIMALLIHFLVFSIVGYLYENDFLEGKLLGKICYFVFWILGLLGSIFLANLCKNDKFIMIILILVLLIFNIVNKIIKHIQDY